MSWTAAAALCSSLAVAGCGTVDLGDNFKPPDVQLDEDFFFCRVQPEVVATYHCSGGGAGEGGSCHSARSAMRLDVAGETDMPPACTGLPDNPRVTGAVPTSYQTNLDAARLEVQPDPLSSPFYRRPVGLDSHPRQIFPDSDPAAATIREWIMRGAR